MGVGPFLNAVRRLAGFSQGVQRDSCQWERLDFGFPSRILAVSTEMEQLTITFPKHSALLSPDEIYESVDAELLRSLSEDRRIERKSAGIHDLSLGEYFSMWSNTVPDGGLIVVGIEDGGTISGCHKLHTRKLNELEKAPRRLCPEARVESKRVEVVAEDGQPSFVVVFRVQYREDRVVRNHADKAFIRYGDEKHTLSEAEIHELEIDKRQVDIEKEPVSLVYPDDLDRELIRKFVEGVKKVHQPLQSYTEIEVLQQRRLGTIVGGSFRPNTACALAFASDPVALFPGCQIRFLRIDGESEQSGANYNVIKTVPMEGPLPGVLQLHPAALKPESAHARSGILQPPARIYGSLKTKTRTST